MSWNRFKQYTFVAENLGFALDISRVNFPDSFLGTMEGPAQKAFKDMEALEKGAIANPDENRMVGHYWLRNPKLAPSADIARDVEKTVAAIGEFAAKVHKGEIRGAKGVFKNLLCVGIGGSALGPQFVAQALGHPTQDKMRVYFVDNTDPDGVDYTLAELNGKLGETLVIVTSKSGSTPEPANGMIEVEAAYKRAGLDFAKHAVVTTGEDSKLDKHAKAAGFLARFPMWDWVGGRTSELGPVGLLPAALQGIDIQSLLDGAKAMDDLTRRPVVAENPAALLALMWYYCTDGKGTKDMVILPYKDRLLLLSRYLQQLVMESLGKEKDLQGKTVSQGIAVYGNKGSTDQHAYVQQLRDGVANFFATFIEVLRDRDGVSPEVEPQTTSGDYLQGFLLGTREALSEKNRPSLTITVREVSPATVGMLIALYERAVGLYASLIGINAYHQPGVEAGKKAAAATLELKRKLLDALKKSPGKAYTADALAAELGLEPKTELIFKLLEHMAANAQKGVRKESRTPFYASVFSYKP